MCRLVDAVPDYNAIPMQNDNRLSLDRITFQNMLSVSLFSPIARPSR